MIISFAHESGGRLESRQFSLWGCHALQAFGGWACAHLKGFLTHVSDIWAGKTQTDAAGGAGALWASLPPCGLCKWRPRGRWTSYRADDSSQSKVPRESLGETICVLLTSLRNQRTSLSLHSVPRGPPGFKVRRHRLHLLMRGVPKNSWTCFKTTNQLGQGKHLAWGMAEAPWRQHLLPA